MTDKDAYDLLSDEFDSLMEDHRKLRTEMDLLKQEVAESTNWHPDHLTPAQEAIVRRVITWRYEQGDAQALEYEETVAILKKTAEACGWRLLSSGLRRI